MGFLTGVVVQQNTVVSHILSILPIAAALGLICFFGIRAQRKKKMAGITDANANFSFTVPKIFVYVGLIVIAVIIVFLLLRQPGIVGRWSSDEGMWVKFSDDNTYYLKGQDSIKSGTYYVTHNNELILNRETNAGTKTIEYHYILDDDVLILENDKEELAFHRDD